MTKWDWTPLRMRMNTSGTPITFRYRLFLATPQSRRSLWRRLRDAWAAFR